MQFFLVCGDADLIPPGARVNILRAPNETVASTSEASVSNQADNGQLRVQGYRMNSMGPKTRPLREMQYSQAIPSHNTSGVEYSGVDRYHTQYQYVSEL